MKKELDQAAEAIVQRINDKLRGTEFPARWQKGLRNKDRFGHEDTKELSHGFTGNANEQAEQSSKLRVEDQVDLLI